MPVNQFARRIWWVSSFVLCFSTSRFKHDENCQNRHGFGLKPRDYRLTRRDLWILISRGLFVLYLERIDHKRLEAAPLDLYGHRLLPKIPSVAVVDTNWKYFVAVKLCTRFLTKLARTGRLLLPTTIILIIVDKTAPLTHRDCAIVSSRFVSGAQTHHLVSCPIACFGWYSEGRTRKCYYRSISPVQ